MPMKGDSIGVVDGTTKMLERTETRKGNQRNLILNNFIHKKNYWRKTPKDITKVQIKELKNIQRVALSVAFTRDKLNYWNQIILHA